MNKLHQIMGTQIKDMKQEVSCGQRVKLENDRSDFTFSECHIKEEPEDKQMLFSVYSELRDTNNTKWNIDIKTEIQTRTQGVQIQKVKFEKDDFCLEKIDDTHCFETTSSYIYEVDSLNKNMVTGLRAVIQEEEEKDKHIPDDKMYIFENKKSNCNDKSFKNNILVGTETIKHEMQDCAQYGMYLPLEHTCITTDNNNSYVENSDLILENKFVNVQSSDLKPENEQRFLDESDINMENSSSLIDRYNDNISRSCTNTEESLSKITDTEVKIENNGLNTDKCCVKSKDYNFKNRDFGIEPLVVPIATAEPSIAGHLNTFREETEAVWQPVVWLKRLPDNIFEDGTQNSYFHPEKRCTLEQFKSCDKNNWQVSAKLADQVNTKMLKTKLKNLMSRNMYNGFHKTDNLFINGKGDGKFTDSDTLTIKQPTDSRGDLGTYNMSNQGLNSVESMRQQEGSNNIDCPHQCNVCGNRFITPSCLRTHMISHSTECPHQCDVCGKAFKYVSHLKYHMTSHSSVRPHQCDICGKSFKSLNHVMRHKVSHSTERPHECNVCGKTFKTRRNLTLHWTCHSTERPHECNVCGRRFKTTQHLTNHIVTHSIERPHGCGVCGKTFKRRSHLRKHKDCHSTMCPHQCNVCGIRFKLLINLRKHMSCHSTECPHQCNVCGKAYKGMSGLRLHQASYCSEKQHACNVCGKTVKTLTQARQHEVSHKPEKAVECNRCDLQFNRMADLRSHIICHHGH